MNDTNWQSRVTLLVNSCDAYADLWQPFFTLLKRYFVPLPDEILLNTETKAYNNQEQQDDSTNQDHFSHSNQISQWVQNHFGYLFQNVPGIGSSLFDLSRNTAGEIIR